MKNLFQPILCGLVILALVAIDLLRGGTQMAFALPTYGILALGALLAIFHARRASPSRPSMVCLVVTILCFGYLLGRTALSPDQFLARTNLYLIGAALMIYFLSGFHVARSNLRMAIVAVLLALGLANCAVGAVQFFKTQNYIPFDFLMPRPDYGSRASGFYNSPNHLAGLLEVTILMGFSLAWWSRWPTYAKILCGYVAVMCIGGLLITGSRGGYLGASCGLVVFVFMSLWLVVRRVPERRWMLLAGIAVFALTVVLGVQKTVSKSRVLEERATSMIEQNEGGLRHLLGVRRMMGNAALKQFLLSPALGTGAGTYLYYGRLFRAPAVQNDPIYAHNDYLQLLAEYGVIGLAAVLIFLNFHLRNGWRWVNEITANGSSAQSNSLALTIGAVSCVVAYMAHAILDFNLHIPANALVIAFVFGLLANPEGEHASATPEPGWLLPAALRIAPAGLGVWMMAIALPKLPAAVLQEKVRMLMSTTAYLEVPETAQKVADDARNGLAHDPGNTELYHDLGEAQLARAVQSDDPAERQRHYEESIEAYRKALQIAPQDRNLLLCLGWSLDALEQFTESEAIFEQALQLDPNAADVRWAQAAHWHRAGKRDAAEIQYRAAAKLGSRPAELGLERLVNERK